MGVLTYLWQFRIHPALTSLPGLHGWLITAAAFAVLAMISSIIGISTGFIKFEPVRKPALLALIFAGGLLSPAFVEELLFRAVLLPGVAEQTSLPQRAFWMALSTFLYVAFHPLNGHFIQRSGKEVFRNPVFLTLTALLGLCLASIYSALGSIWPCVLIHWLYTALWLSLLGGVSRFVKKPRP